MNTTNAQSQEPIKPTDRPLSFQEAAELHRKALKTARFAVVYGVHSPVVQLDALFRESALQDPPISVRE